MARTSVPVASNCRERLIKSVVWRTCGHTSSTSLVAMVCVTTSRLVVRACTSLNLLMSSTGTKPSAFMLATKYWSCMSEG